MQPEVERTIPSSPSSLDDLRFAVVDVETSGLSARSHRILQVAVVTARADGTIVDRWSSYIRPRWRWFVRLGPRHIHGIRRRDLRSAPPVEEVMHELAGRLDGTVVAAHNLAFDWEFLSQTSARSGAALPSCPRLCTLELSRSLVAADDAAPLDADQPRVSHRLVDLCDRYGIALTNAHDALADAEATAGLLPHLLREAGITTSEQLLQLAER